MKGFMRDTKTMTDVKGMMKKVKGVCMWFLRTVSLQTICVVLSITLGINILLILGAKELAVRVAQVLPASIVICPVYFVMKRFFGLDEREVIE